MEIGVTVSFPPPAGRGEAGLAFTGGAIVLSLLVSVALVFWRAQLVELRQDRYRSLLRAALAVLAVAIPVAVLVFAIPDLDNGIRGQIAALVVAVAGWFMTYLQDQAQREEDQLDLLEALRAEIQLTVHQFEESPPRAAGDRLDALIAAAIEADKTYVPFLPAASRPIVFEALAGKVDQMPTEVVQRVVKFYSLLADIRAHADELQGSRFAELPIERRRPAYRRYFEMMESLEAQGRDAIEAINTRFSYQGWTDRAAPACDGRAAGHELARPDDAVSRTGPALSGPGSAQAADGG